MKKPFPISNRVRELRIEKEGVTQSELGEAVGVTRQTIAAIEQRHYSPSLETAFKIAFFFDVPLEQVFFWDEVLAKPAKYQAD